MHASTQRETQSAELWACVLTLSERQDGLQEQVMMLSGHVTQLSERVQHLSECIESWLQSQGGLGLALMEHPAPEEVGQAGPPEQATAPGEGNPLAPGDRRPRN